MGWVDRPDAVSAVLKSKQVAYDRMMLLGTAQDASSRRVLLNAINNFLQWADVRPSVEDDKDVRRLLRAVFPTGASWSAHDRNTGR